MFSWNLLLMYHLSCRERIVYLVSILVFVELALDGSHLCPSRCRCSLVSILVFVELALDEHTGYLLACRCCVSILVFVELALDVWGYGGLGSSYTGFQSLFSWNLLLMFLLSGHLICHLRVSILVFVELALDARSEKLVWVRPYRFNPCFRGTCS